HNAYIGAAWQDALRSEMQHCSVYGNNKGVVLSNVIDGLFTHIEIHNNSVNGLELSASFNNTFHHVYCIDNMYGVYAMDSTGNLFYFNDFIGNEQHAWDNGNNSWDNGTVGNYWKGFDGGSRLKGTYTSPYLIPGGSNVDNHPLIRRAGLPVPSFNYQPGLPFTLQTVTFTDTSIDLDGVIVQRYWDFGDGSNATSMNQAVTHAYSDNGTFTVTLTVTDDDGNTGIATKTLTVLNMKPTATFTWKPPEPTDVDLVRFNGSRSVDPDGDIINYTWDFGDGTTGYGENVTHRFADTGTYNVTLTVTDDDGETGIKVMEILIGNAPPVPAILFSPGDPSTADSIMFNGSGSIDPDGEIVNYTWDFGDDTTGYGVAPRHSYADNGTYTVTLYVTDDQNDTASTSINVAVTNVPPRVAFSYRPSRPDDISQTRFTDESFDPDGTIVSWQWTFDDGSTGTDRNPQHIFSENKVYTITLTVTDDDGATNTTTLEVEIFNVPPRPSFSYEPATPTDLDTVQFIDTSGDPDGSITAWKWTFGDGNSSTAQDPSHAYTHDGLYTVTLAVTDDDGDTATETYSILIANVPPKVNFSYTPAEPTDTQDISFTGDVSDPDGEITNYTWDWGDGSTSYGADATHRYADDGTYTVTLTAKDDDGDTTRYSRDVNVSNVAPTPSFTYEPDDPKTGKYVTFRDTSTDPDGDVVNATWYFGDGASQQNGDILSHQYDDEGTYEVTLIVTDNDGATAETSQFIEVKDEDQAAGFEFVVLIAAMGILLIMWKRRMGVWRRR
ncbi:MAG: PKD domain-containing protein, partial [Thermoplasmatota archaeon]